MGWELFNSEFQLCCVHHINLLVISSHRYFIQLVEEFETNMIQYRQQIEEMEHHLTSLGQTTSFTPQGKTWCFIPAQINTYLILTSCMLQNWPFCSESCMRASWLLLPISRSSMILSRLVIALLIKPAPQDWSLPVSSVRLRRSISWTIVKCFTGTAWISLSSVGKQEQPQWRVDWRLPLAPPLFQEWPIRWLVLWQLLLIDPSSLLLLLVSTWSSILSTRAFFSSSLVTVFCEESFKACNHI